MVDFNAGRTLFSPRSRNARSRRRPARRSPIPALCSWLVHPPDGDGQISTAQPILLTTRRGALWEEKLNNKIIRSLASVVFAVATMLAVGSAARAATVPYQAYINHSTCVAGDCVFNFSAVPAGHRIELKHVSCYVRGDVQLSIDFVQLIVIKPGASNAVYATSLLIDGSGELDGGSTTWTAIIDTSAFAVAGNHFQIFARPLAGKFIQIACGIDGSNLS
jgi:hypothetical protein